MITSVIFACCSFLFKCILFYNFWISGNWLILLFHLIEYWLQIIRIIWNLFIDLADILLCLERLIQNSILLNLLWEHLIRLLESDLIDRFIYRSNRFSSILKSDIALIQTKLSWKLINYLHLYWWKCCLQIFAILIYQYLIIA